MTDLNPAQLQWLHDELGDQPSDEALQERYDALGSIRDVAIAVLRRRRTDLLNSPLSTSASGIASVNLTENVKAISQRIDALSRLDPDPTDEPGEDTDGGSGQVDLEPIELYRTRGR